MNYLILNIYKGVPCPTCPYNSGRCDEESIWQSCSLIIDFVEESYNHKLVLMKARNAKGKPLTPKKVIIDNVHAGLQ